MKKKKSILISYISKYLKISSVLKYIPQDSCLGLCTPGRTGFVTLRDQLDEWISHLSSHVNAS